MQRSGSPWKELRFVSSRSFKSMAGSEEVDSLVQRMDVGPKYVVLQQALHEAGGLARLLDFTQDVGVLARAKRLAALLAVHKELPEVPGAVTRAVADYVYSSNMIEGEQIGIGATRELVERRLKSGIKDTRGVETPTLALLELVVDTYKPNLALYEVGSPGSPDPSFAVGGVVEWRKWHALLMAGAKNADPGNFRRGGVYAGQHIFPHHTVVDATTKRLSDVAKSLSHSIAKVPDLAKTFGLAAFVQYHFVNIHPFCDGNGRMCRFLAKRILDTVLPLPIPQFSDRNAYLSAVSTSDGPCMWRPLRLCVLLLDEAIAMYERHEMVAAVAEKSRHTYAIDAGTEDELDVSCKLLGLSPEDAAAVLGQWRSIDWTKTAQVSVRGGAFVVVVSKPMGRDDFADI